MTDAGPTSPTDSSSPWAAVLVAAGLVYVALGAVLGLAFVLGAVQSSLFPTGWLFPAVLATTGLLMAVRRRFDVVISLWAGLTLAVFMLSVLLYVDALNFGVDDAAAFDSSIIVAAFGLVPLLLRPWFRP